MAHLRHVVDSLKFCVESRKNIDHIIDRTEKIVRICDALLLKYRDTAIDKNLEWIRMHTMRINEESRGIFRTKDSKPYSHEREVGTVNQMVEHIKTMEKFLRRELEEI